MRTPLVLSTVLLLGGCGVDSEPPYVANFHPPSVSPGYTRFLTPTVKVAPGENVAYCQWVAGPASSPQDVIDVIGLQSATGHHAVLYGTTATQFAVGETHVCTPQDMLPISFVAGIGGEGTAGSAAATLPDGLYFRLPAGRALMMTTHWLNATDAMVDGQTVIDVKFAPASDQRQIADVFANSAFRFQVTPGPSSYDVSCVLLRDFTIAMATNHMHERGASAYTELIRPDGSSDMLVADATWASDQSTNAHYNRFSLAAPKLGHAGDTIHTHCQWLNSTASTFAIPDEMCVGTAFYFPGEGQIVCTEGAWPTK